MGSGRGALEVKVEVLEVAPVDLERHLGRLREGPAFFDTHLEQVGLLTAAVRKERRQEAAVVEDTRVVGLEAEQLEVLDEAVPGLDNTTRRRIDDPDDVARFPRNDSAVASARLDDVGQCNDPERSRLDLQVSEVRRVATTVL